MHLAVLDTGQLFCPVLRDRPTNLVQKVKRRQQLQEPKWDPLPSSKGKEKPLDLSEPSAMAPKETAAANKNAVTITSQPRATAVPIHRHSFPPAFPSSTDFFIQSA